MGLNHAGEKYFIVNTVRLLLRNYEESYAEAVLISIRA